MWSVCVFVCLSVCLTAVSFEPRNRGAWTAGAYGVVAGFKFVSPAKTAEAIEMLFMGLTPVGPRNHVLYGVELLHRKEQFWGMFGPLKDIWRLLRCRTMHDKREHSVLNYA